MACSEPIRKVATHCREQPHLADYETARQHFSWESARCELDGLPRGRGLNIAHEAVDRHAAGSRRNHVALRWLGKSGQQSDVTYGELSALTNQFANALQKLGVGPGERVYVLTGRILELYVTALGTLKNRSVFCPLFFGVWSRANTLATGDRAGASPRHDRGVVSTQGRGAADIASAA